MKIIINPGHYPGADSGAVNTTYVTGVTYKEAIICLDIAKRVKNNLIAAGYSTELLQNNNVSALAIAPTKDDVFVSIHLNSVSGDYATQQKATGTETLYKGPSDLSYKLANCIQTDLVQSLKLPDRGAKSDTRGLAVVTNSRTNQTALVEIGFICNDTELKKILNNYDTIASSIANGIKTYLKTDKLNELVSQESVTTHSTVDKANKSAAVASGTEDTSTGNKITNFLDFMAVKYFQTQFSHTFSEAGYNSLWNVIGSFVSFFFYNFYTIPNLINNKIMIVKPETIFGFAPLCNLIVPSIKSNISYNRAYKSEPTRLFLKTSPITITGATGNTPLGSIAAVENSPSEQVEYTDSLGGTAKTTKIVETITNIPSVTSVDDVSKLPMFTATEFEKKFGIRLTPTYGGSEILAFLSSKDGKFNKDNSVDELKQLSRYLLAKQRYALRSGTISMFFNPYIVPGFPFISLENKDLTPNALNIYGYITSVVHNINANDWSTSVSYTYGHTDVDAVPDVFPIVDDDYDPSKGSSGATEIYNKILGPTINAIDPTEATDKYGYLTARQSTVLDAYNVIHRPATTLDTYVKTFASGAQVIENNNYMYISGSDYFRTDVQKVLHSYSTKCLSDNRSAFSTNDVR